MTVEGDVLRHMSGTRQEDVEGLNPAVGLSCCGSLNGPSLHKPSQEHRPHWPKEAQGSSVMSV